jgi:hypothetical protein
MKRTNPVPPPFPPALVELRRFVEGLEIAYRLSIDPDRDAVYAAMERRRRRLARAAARRRTRQASRTRFRRKQRRSIRTRRNVHAERKRRR